MRSEFLFRQHGGLTVETARRARSKSGFRQRKWAFGTLQSLGALILAIGAGSLASAQDASAPEAASARSDDPAADAKAVDSFLERKARAQARREARIERKGEAADKREVRRLTRALGIERPKPFGNLTEDRVDALQESLIEDVTQLVILLDMKPGKIKTLRQEGFDPLQSASSFVRGTSKLLDQAILSDRTVLAKPRQVIFEELGDGFGSTVVLDIEDTYVGRVGAKRVRFRQRSGVSVAGERVAYANDIDEGDTASYVFTLSRGLYEEAAVSDGATPVLNQRNRPRYFAVLGTRYQVQNGTAIPDGGVGQVTSLSGIKEALSPLARVRRDNNLDEQEEVGEE